jgi:integrase
MAEGKITKRAVDAANPGNKDSYLWDADLAGFALKVTPAGSKVYLVQYRLGGRNGRTRRVTIGRHGSPWTPESARKEAKRLLGEVGAGRDPAEAKQKEKDNITVAQLSDQYLEAAPFIVLPRKKRPKKASTLATDHSNIERHIKPLLGRKRLRSITRLDVEKFQRDVATGKTAVDVRTKPRGRAIVRGGEGTAARATAVLGTLFSYAIKERICTDNPVRGVTLYEGEKKERFLTAAELADLGDALSAAQQDGENPFAVTAIRLLVLTGARKSEILTLKWEHVDTERGRLRLPDSKTGAKVIPLGAAALEILSEIPRVESNPYVLPGLEGRHFVGLQKTWERIRKRAGLEDVRLHDLRHSFASVAVAGGSSLYLVGKVLGHEQASTTERYAHLADDPLRAVADKTAGQIAAAMGRQEAEVVKLPKRKA